MLKFITAALLLLQTAAGGVAQAQAPATTSARQVLERQIDSFLRSKYNSAEPGAAVIVTADTKVLFRDAYGMANLELNIPLLPEMTFGLASLTKPITAAAIMILEEEGKVDLEAPLSRYLPAFPAGDHVLLQHLLSHTSGIVDFLRNGSIVDSLHKEYTPDELVALIENKPLQFPPGTQSAYSNSNYLLLGKVIETVTGRSWEDFLRVKLFEPAGMYNTYYGGHYRVIPLRAFGYEITPDSTAWRHEDPISWTIGFGLGGLFSSVDDLARLNRALDTGRLISPQTRERMFTPFTLADGQTARYGYGWGIAEMLGRRVVRHTGDVAGYRTHVLKFPDDGLFVAILSNRWEREPAPAKMAEEIALIVLEEMGQEQEGN